MHNFLNGLKKKTQLFTLFLFVSPKSNLSGRHLGAQLHDCFSSQSLWQKDSQRGTTAANCLFKTNPQTKHVYEPFNSPQCFIQFCNQMLQHFKRNTHTNRHNASILTAQPTSWASLQQSLAAPATSMAGCEVKGGSRYILHESNRIVLLQGESIKAPTPVGGSTTTGSHRELWLVAVSLNGGIVATGCYWWQLFGATAGPTREQPWPQGWHHPAAVPDISRRVCSHERAPKLSHRKKKEDNEVSPPPLRPSGGLSACLRAEEQVTLSESTTRHPTRGRTSEDRWRESLWLQVGAGGLTQPGDGRRLEKEKRKCRFHSGVSVFTYLTEKKTTLWNVFCFFPLQQKVKAKAKEKMKNPHPPTKC